MIRLNVPSQPTIDLLDIAKEYRELWELREKVRKAEIAAAEVLKLRGKSSECTRPVARVVSRKRVTRQSREFTRRELYAMLADAARNTSRASAASVQK
jgi:hypothetical protein